MPEDCGSTRPRTVCAVISASAAVPPAASTSQAAFVDTGFAVDTAKLAVRTAVMSER